MEIEFLQRGGGDRNRKTHYDIHEIFNHAKIRIQMGMQYFQRNTQKYITLCYYYVVFKLCLEAFHSTVFGTTKKFIIPNILKNPGLFEYRTTSWQV